VKAKVRVTLEVLPFQEIIAVGECNFRSEWMCSMWGFCLSRLCGEPQDSRVLTREPVQRWLAGSTGAEVCLGKDPSQKCIASLHMGCRTSAVGRKGISALSVFWLVFAQVGELRSWSLVWGSLYLLVLFSRVLSWLPVWKQKRV